ncbi:MFS transporter [Aurantimonas sp. MSK8Z-1]|uniref:MFS transporter n=1 Tax=Mangrovibrevibacter kandeliae TaxID=2968473 RepID=UPI002119B285|nr:MFS transporter [Aurantimonas sp. MSK8Z-1]MCW4113919.1 MFS transporter [Aurantimonas sp. MSK8Z-1]
MSARGGLPARSIPRRSPAAVFRNTFRSLANPNYRLWAAGALVSNIGTWMQRTAQDWLVLTELTDHNAAAVGLVMSLQFGPQLLLLPLTGFAADYFDKRKLMMVTQAVMGVLATALGVLTVSGQAELWQVYVFALLLGCAAAFDAPARHSFVSELVEEKDLVNAVGLNSTSFNGARMVGPAVAGVVIAWVGSGWAFLINGVSFAAVLISLFFLRVDLLHRGKRASRGRGSLMQGFRYVWGRPDLAAICVMLFVFATFGLNFPIFISTMAATVFHTGPSGYGLLTSALAVGTVAGALFAAGREETGFRHLVGGATVFGFGCAAAAVMPNEFFFALALMVIGVAALTFNNGTNSLMQLSSAPEMRGRVMAIRLAIAMGCTPLGSPLVGWIADRFGPRWALGLGALAGLGAAVIGLWYMRGAGRPPAVREPAMQTTDATASAI